MTPNRRRAKREPICHWCRGDVTDDDGWRTPIFSRGDEYAQGLLAGWVICGPDCLDRPVGMEVYLKRLPLAQLKRLSQREQAELSVGRL